MQIWENVSATVLIVSFCPFVCLFFMCFNLLRSVLIVFFFFFKALNNSSLTAAWLSRLSSTVPALSLALHHIYVIRYTKCVGLIKFKLICSGVSLWEHPQCHWEMWRGLFTFFKKQTNWKEKRQMPYPAGSLCSGSVLITTWRCLNQARIELNDVFVYLKL